MKGKCEEVCLTSFTTQPSTIEVSMRLYNGVATPTAVDVDRQSFVKGMAFRGGSDSPFHEGVEEKEVLETHIWSMLLQKNIDLNNGNFISGPGKLRKTYFIH